MPYTAIRVRGAIVVYRLYDVGYAIHLEAALRMLASNAPERVQPIRDDAHAIHIANPPVSVLLATEEVVVDGVTRAIEISARLFDFGVCSLRVRCALPSGSSWEDFRAYGAVFSNPATCASLFARHVDALTRRIMPAIDRPQLSSAAEDFIVFRVNGLSDNAGVPLAPEMLTDDAIAALLLNEPRPLALHARSTLLSHRFAYYDDDLTVLAWDSALVVEPAAGNEDIAYVLEFANAQLLELRVYDALLDAELPTMYERIAAVRTNRFPIAARSLRRLLTRLQTRVADITEPIERVENALKVTDDVYLARVYAAALEIFRERAWRTGIDRKLTIMRDTYSMLNAETQAIRSELLEIIVVILIVAEVAIALIRP